ncbi:hypothetical protein PPL_11066 [Heterostelium album PN500]|uniref:RING-type domain-containing protein n=1 Tax=Heterostelium pallidum (strain ATCC 26659 / Pp 5 / PN500) TaxID=670386 RepID=D3BSU6_HETP5|nr:hypothetical protein PPL_11066 [Heterostelium album PN500]EFA75561.1 hypothetical protein PPL_11066 [Heterostelium album PN500]|eukprot:XP_020427695.1 hypothetical protein PPL_11066 [Heterostelium album PN500]
MDDHQTHHDVHRLVLSFGRVDLHNRSCRTRWRWSGCSVSSGAYAIEIPILTSNFDSFIVCGLYYGVLGRDFAEICSIRIANLLGIGGSRLPTTKLSNNYCAICTGSLDNSKHNFSMESTASYGESIAIENKENNKPHILDGVMNLLFSKKSCKLACEHSFHLYCIRGWALVGKNNVCPNCNEKVDIKSFCDNPWEKNSLIWGVLLDSTRYLISWNPVIFLGTQGIIYLFDR